MKKGTERICKAALVTGSTSGIGKAIARTLARMGFAIILSGRRDASKVQPFIAELERLSGSSSIYVQGDIAREDIREKMRNKVALRFGALDVLVNNAGITTSGRKDILALTEEEMLTLLKVNLIAPFFLVSSLVPLLRNHQDPAYIINISSISAYTVSTNRADYCISKAGLSMMTQLFAARLAQENITVFELRPGIIRTHMTAPVKEKYDHLIEQGLLPIQRWGKPDDVGKAVAAIVQGYFPYSTGEVIDIDGGFHIRRL